MRIDLLHSPDTLGIFAGFMTTISFLPQLLKTWKTKSANDVSIGMFLFFIGGVSLWCLYGWEIHALPVIIANFITFLLASSILALKLIFDSKKEV